MRVWIDQDLCTGAGLCVDRCPDLFVVLEDGLGYVHDRDVVFTEPGQLSVAVPPRHDRAAVDAAEHCPGECIYLEAEPPPAVHEDESDIVDADIVDDPT
jgi:ferredoxin